MRCHSQPPRSDALHIALITASHSLGSISAMTMTTSKVVGYDMKMSMNKGTILVIDDEPDLVELVQFNLQKDGYEVIVANNGKSGVEIALRHVPDVVVLDIMMPGIDGLEVCRQLRADSRTKSVPMIMLTAKAGEA